MTNVFYNAMESQPQQSRRRSGRKKKKSRKSTASISPDSPVTPSRSSWLKTGLLTALAFGSPGASMAPRNRPLASAHTTNSLSQYHSHSPGSWTPSSSRSYTPSLSSQSPYQQLSDHHMKKSSKKAFSNHCTGHGDDYMCHSGLYPRRQMPQINYKDPDFRAYLHKLGYSLSPAPETTDLRSLAPLQTEMLGSKVRGISRNITSKKFDPSSVPLLVAIHGGNPYIVNGHHRWAGSSHAVERKQKTKHRKDLFDSESLARTQAIMAIRNTSGQKRNAKRILDNMRAYHKSEFASL